LSRNKSGNLLRNLVGRNFLLFLRSIPPPFCLFLSLVFLGNHTKSNTKIITIITKTNWILGDSWEQKIFYFCCRIYRDKICLHCLSGSATKPMNVMVSAKTPLFQTKRITSEATTIISFSVLVGMTKMTAEDRWLSKRRTKSTTQDSTSRTLTSEILSIAIIT